VPGAFDRRRNVRRRDSVCLSQLPASAGRWADFASLKRLNGSDGNFRFDGHPELTQAKFLATVFEIDACHATKNTPRIHRVNREYTKNAPDSTQKHITLDPLYGCARETFEDLWLSGGPVTCRNASYTGEFRESYRANEMDF
jgi:hypothetical protein